MPNWSTERFKQPTTGNIAAVFASSTLNDLANQLSRGSSAVVDVDVDPLDFVRSGSASFAVASYFGSPGGTRVGGLGVAWQERSSGEDRFVKADAARAAAGWSDAVRALVGFSFADDGPRQPEWDGFPAASVHVPQAAVIEENGRRRLVIVVPPGLTADDLLTTLAGLEAPGRAVLPEFADHVIEATPSPGEWRDEVSQAVAAIQGGAMLKVVLARSVIVRTEGPILAFDLVAHLAHEYPQCFAFGWQIGDATFIGASPELLVERAGEKVRSQPHAGSAARGRGDEEDRTLGEGLLSSAKDRREHALVVDDIVRLLEPVTSSLQVPTTPSLRKMTTVQHLSTTIDGVLDEDSSVIELAGLLHPTPAVGGVPRQEALAFIDKVERMDRGWYLGGVGWCDAAGNGQMAVALRCGLLRGDTAHLQAGAGIVADSDPEAELIETRLKFGPLLSVLTAT